MSQMRVCCGENELAKLVKVERAVLIAVVLSDDVVAIDLSSRDIVLVKEVSELVGVDRTVSICIDQAERLLRLEIWMECQVLASKFDLNGVSGA